MNSKLIKASKKLIHDFKTDAAGDPSKAMIVFAVHANETDSTILSTFTGGHSSVLSLLVNGFVKVFSQTLITANVTDPIGLKRELINNLEKQLDNILLAHVVNDQSTKH